jgi:hypothetical protein
MNEAQLETLRGAPPKLLMIAQWFDVQQSGRFKHWGDRREVQNDLRTYAAAIAAAIEVLEKLPKTADKWLHVAGDDIWGQDNLGRLTSFETFVRCRAIGSDMDYSPWPNPYYSTRAAAEAARGDDPEVER